MIYIIICKICGKEYKSYKSLGLHIRAHNLSSKDYYDIYLKKPNEDKCVVCGKSTRYINISHGYMSHCSIRCSQIDPETQDKIKQTNQKKYGCDCVFQNKKIKQKIQDSVHKHYGELGLADPTVTNKKKQTCLDKYGVENPMQLDSIKTKVENTNLTKYGAKNIYASEYGKQRSKQTKLERYDDENYNNHSQAAKSYKETISNRSKEKTAEIGKHISEAYQNFSNEKKQQIAQKISIAQKEHYKNLTDEERQLLSVKNSFAASCQTIESHKKSIQTKIKNGTYIASPVEDKFYERLLCIFDKNDIKRQYISDEYPFVCDFYIKSIDTYIEIHNHWTHGKMKYDARKSICKQQLAIWKEKAKTSKYFKNAINTWTIRDVKKYKCAKKNHLNYICLYSLKEIDQALIKLREMVK